MAIAIKCDKCGMASTKAEYFMHIRTHTMSSATEYNYRPTDYFELCQKCYDEIFSFKKESEEK